MTEAPKKLKIMSDDSIIEYVRTIKTKTETSFEYTYIKSILKMNNVTFSENVLIQFINNRVLVEVA